MQRPHLPICEGYPLQRKLSPGPLNAVQVSMGVSGMNRRVLAESIRTSESEDSLSAFDIRERVLRGALVLRIDKAPRAGRKELDLGT